MCKTSWFELGPDPTVAVFPFLIPGLVLSVKFSESMSAMKKMIRVPQFAILYVIWVWWFLSTELVQAERCRMWCRSVQTSFVRRVLVKPLAWSRRIIRRNIVFRTPGRIYDFFPPRNNSFPNPRCSVATIFACSACNIVMSVARSGRWFSSRPRANIFAHSREVAEFLRDK